MPLLAHVSNQKKLPPSDTIIILSNINIIGNNGWKSLVNNTINFIADTPDEYTIDSTIYFQNDNVA